MGFPSTPSNGQTATVNGILYTYSSARTAWVRTSTNDRALFTASNIAPTTPTLGDKWYYIAGDIVYEYINDGTTNYWVDTSGAIYSSNVNTSATLVGETLVAGNIIPTANITYTLGNTTHRWKDLYLSGNTIFLGGATISTNGSNVAITNPAGGSFSVTGSVAGSANVSFGNVFANYFFANGAAFTSSSFGNTEVAAYLIANPPAGTFSNTQVAGYITSPTAGVSATTGAVTLPIGTTAQRPGTTANGMMRFNTTTSAFEMYFPTAGWQTLYVDNQYSVTAFIWGGGGGGGFASGAGGGAGAAVGTFTVTRSSSYPVTVGGGGDTRNSNAGPGASAVGGGGTAGPSGFGGCGGGYSGVFNGSTTQGNAILIAGGGGGASWEGPAGGNGGGTVGTQGGNSGGGGGTQSAGGSAGAGSSAGSALQGAPATGGDGGGGGGGGGGYFGGGGGTNNNPGSGGGGGSGYFSPTLVTEATLYTGSGTTAGNPNDGLRNPATAGNGGASGANVGQAGLVVIRYIGTAQRGSGGTVSISGGFVYHTFTSSGTFVA